MPRFSTLVTVVLLLAIARIHLAQEEPSAVFEGLVEVSEVLLDVLAVDKKGNVVRGLGKDDFVVMEDGEFVELTSVTFYTTRYEPQVPEDPDAVPSRPLGPDEVVEVPSSRFFVLFFHEQRFSRTHRGPQHIAAGRHAHDWVRDQMAPSDWLAVVSHERHLRVHQDFTQDRESLMAAIAEAARGLQGEDPQPSQWKREASASHFSLRRGLPAPPDLQRETRVIYDAIRLVGEATRPIVGRKNLLLFTLGFGDFDDITLKNEPDYRYYPAMIQSLNDTNVALYPIDVTHRDVFSSQANFLLRLALESGGLYLSNRTSFKSRIDRIVTENSGYYLLSFRTEHPAGESGYRNVRVGTKYRGVRIRARRGYRYGV